MLKSAKQRGLTLIEVVVAVSIFGALTAASLPSMMSWVRGNDSRTHAESLAAGLRQARIEAIKRGRPVTFWLVTAPPGGGNPTNECALSAGSAAWVIALDDPATKCGASPSADTAPRLIQASGARATGAAVQGLDSEGGAASSVTFNQYGQAVRGAERIAFVNINHTDASVRQYRVELSLAGSVRLCDRGVDKSTKDPRACRIE